MKKKKLAKSTVVKVEKKIEINKSTKVLDVFDEKIQKSQILHQLASTDWNLLIRNHMIFKNIIDVDIFLPEIANGLKDYFVSKLDEVFNQSKTLCNNLSNDDLSILKLLTNQIKTKNADKPLPVEVIEEPKEVEEAVPTTKKLSMAELKKLNPAERAAAVKAELEQTAPVQNRLTMTNNPYRKPPMNEFERQARAMGEASVIKDSAAMVGQNFNHAPAQSIQPADQFVRDPNEI